MNSREHKKPAGKRYRFRFPTSHLSEADFQNLDQVREKIMADAQRTVDPEGKGFDATMMGSDDGSFGVFTDESAWDDWRDRITDLASIASRRVSMSVLSAGFAMSGSNMLGTEANTGYGLGCFAMSGLFTIWAVTANLAKPRR
jgi:hypothetical protein